MISPGAIVGRVSKWFLEKGIGRSFLLAGIGFEKIWDWAKEKTIEQGLNNVII